MNMVDLLFLLLSNIDIRYLSYIIMMLDDYLILRCDI